MEQLTDEQLAEQAARGDDDAFRVLLRRHQNYIFSLIYGMVGHRETAEDLAQEAFIRLYRSIGRFRGDARLTTWLYRLAVNIVTDYRRAQRRRPVTTLLGRMKLWLIGGEGQPEREALEREERQTVHAALARLPDKYRIVLYLYHFKQLSYQEIADVLQVPAKTVETRLYRGKAILKKQLQEVNGHVQAQAGQAGKSELSGSQPGRNNMPS